MLEPATLAGVLEDHHYEQFFFDEPTREALLSLMAGYELPLLLCTPSLAVAAEQAGQRCLLLDRDERFAFLSAFQAFDLDRPSRLEEPFDAIVCDPPFANFELPRLRAAIEALRPGASEDVPLFIAYNSRREAELQAAFGAQQLRRLRPLGYMSVKPKTQRHLFLYGPAGVPSREEEADSGGAASCDTM